MDILESALSEVTDYANILQIGYSWLYEIASSLKSSSSSIEEAKNNLLKQVESLATKTNSTLSVWKSHFKSVTESWLCGLFQYIPQPLLSKTNNDLEIFNKKVKKNRRKITGQKNTQHFLRRFGVAVSFLLGLPADINLQHKASKISYSVFRKEREQLFDRAQQSKLYKIRKDLGDYLFELEIRWSNLPTNCV